MTIVLSTLIVLFLPLVATNAGLFDLAEYRRVSYDATIGEDFLWFAPDLDLRKVTSKNIDDYEKRIVANIPDESLPNYVFITSKGGQKFACSLPDVEELKRPNVSKSSKNPKIYGDALAASFYVDKCIKLRGNHWWSYILCRGQTVEQIHGEHGQEEYVKNILGLFDGSLTMPSWQESTEDRLLYIEESYTSGTFCDLEDFREPRSTTVRYECDSQLSTNEAYVSSVVEVRPCQYLMTVKVGTLCHYPEFLPAGQANTKNIGCQPYLTRKNVRELLEKQLEEKRKEDSSKKNLAIARKEFHRAIERFNAMTKSTRVLYLPDVMKKMNAEMDYHAAHFNLLVASLESEGEQLTNKKRDYMWKLFSTADIGDYMFYADYDSISDENRAHLWYYFHDPSWPKDQFPKDIMSIAIQNAYIEEVQSDLILGQYVYDDDFYLVEGLSHFLKTGEVDSENNLLISAMDIHDEIAEMGSAYAETRYPWLQAVHMFFSEEQEVSDSVAIGRIIKSIMKPAKGRKYFPMGNLARTAIKYVLDEVWEDMLEISRDGHASQIVDEESDSHKAIYDELKIEKFDEPKRKDKHTFNYGPFLEETKDGLYNMELVYQNLLAPLYQLISIQWFQRKTPFTFHVSPLSQEHLIRSNSNDYKFHLNLSRDLAYFARMLTFTTISRIREFQQWRDGKKETLITSERLQARLMEKPIPVDKETYNIAFWALHDNIGPSTVAKAKEQIWKKKIEKYRTNYWITDYRLRKQAQAMQGLMKDFLSVKDDSTAFVSLGGNSGSKKNKFDEELLKKLSMFGPTEDLNFESLTDRLFAPDDDRVDEWDEMHYVMDLLDKAGLSKKTEVQIKMFDSDGNEIQSEELDAAAKSLFGLDESMSRFKETEKAYSKNLGKDEEDD